MDSIGLTLKNAREEAGVSLHEASEDLKIKEVVLCNIEDGNIGGFKDIFELKENVLEYAKYLGQDIAKIDEKFNEYVFEYTSKIPVKEIEKAVLEKNKEETKEIRIISPYTNQKSNQKDNRIFIVIYTLVFILLAFIIIWSVKQITIDSKVANEIAYGK